MGKQRKESRTRLKNLKNVENASLKNSIYKQSNKNSTIRKFNLKEIEDVIQKNKDMIQEYGSYETLEKAYNDNNPQAIFDVYVFCDIMKCCDEKKQIDLLKIASDLGNEVAQVSLADFYNMNAADDPVLPGNRDEAIKLYKILAEKHNYRGLYQMALYYLDEGSTEYNLNLGVKYFEEVGDHYDSIAEYVAENFEILGDYDRAIKYYKLAKQYEDIDGSYLSDFVVDEENIMSCYYAPIADLYYQKGDIPNAIKYINKGIAVENDSWCHYLRGLIYLDADDVDKAEECFKQSASAESYQKLGELYSDGNYMRPDKEQALYYYERANEQGIDCSSIIDTLKSELNLNQEDEYIHKIKNIINDNIEPYDYPTIAIKDLEEDFGEDWDKLSEFSQSVLITGITSFMTYMSFETKNPRVKLDYSTVIISMARALERETKEIFYNKFRDYLEKNNVDPQPYYIRLREFVLEDKITGKLSYTHKDFWYSLGKLKFIVYGYPNTNPVTKKTYETIDSNLKEFLSEQVFKEDAFPTDRRKAAICEYMIDFANQTDAIARNFRNEAAHTDATSNLARAKSCVNQVLKVEQLLQQFVSKIDYEKVNANS